MAAALSAYTEDIMGEARRRRELGLGPTYRYPDGKISADDDGELVFGVSDMDSKGLITVEFGTAVKWFSMPADTAVAFATLLLKKAGGASRA